MVTARILGVVHTVDNRLAGVDARVTSIDDRVTAVDENIATVIDSAHPFFNQSSKTRLNQCA